MRARKPPAQDYPPVPEIAGADRVPVHAPSQSLRDIAERVDYSLHYSLPHLRLMATPGAA